MMRQSIRVCAAGTALLLLGACLNLGAAPDPTQFFIVGAGGLQDTTFATGGARVGLGPIAVPGYLDTGQLVERVGQDEVTFTPYARWAEPFKPMVARVLATDLRRSEAIDEVVPYPWPLRDPPPYSIEIDFQRFERDGSQVVLAATWSLRDPDAGSLLIIKESVIRVDTDTTTAVATVTAMSNALNRFALELAGEIARVRRRP